MKATVGELGEERKYVCADLILVPRGYPRSPSGQWKDMLSSHSTGTCCLSLSPRFLSFSFFFLCSLGDVFRAGGQGISLSPAGSTVNSYVCDTNSNRKQITNTAPQSSPRPGPSPCFPGWGRCTGLRGRAGLRAGEGVSPAVLPRET